MDVETVVDAASVSRMRIEHYVFVVITLATAIMFDFGYVEAQDNYDDLEASDDTNTTESCVDDPNGELFPFGCCSLLPSLPAHGENDLGCCASSEHGKVI